MGMGYFKMHYDFIDETAMLTDEELGRLVIAILEYARSGSIPKDSLVGNERFVFPCFRQQVDRDVLAYEARVASNAINGKKGGRPRKHENDEINPTVFRKTEKSQDKEKEKDEDKDKDKDKECMYKGA